MTFLFSLILSSSDDEGWLWVAAGACAGVYLFYRGFRELQRKRLIQNTPSSKIRSASMGLVEVSGLATGPYTMPAPITGMPCYFYRTMAWEWTRSGKSHEWKKVADESLNLPFFLDDGTGRVLVDPQGAEMDIHRDFREEFSNSIFSTSLEVPINVSSFLMRHGVSREQKVRIEEYCIKPKNALFILGTLAENPGLKLAPTPVQTVSSSRGTRFQFSMSNAVSHALSIDSDWGDSAWGSSNGETKVTFSQRTTLAPLFRTAEPESNRLNRQPSQSAPATGAEQQARIAEAMMKAGITNPAAWAAAGVQHLAAPVAVVNPGTVDAGNPNAAVGEFELEPKTVICKGTHNTAFFISWQSQRDVLFSLGWKSTLMIWGGPVLTLVCAYLLAERFGWL